jgi:hypothetical protein
LGRTEVQDKLQWFAWRRGGYTIKWACLRGYVCIFVVSMVCTEQVSWAQVHAGACIPQVFLTLPYTSATKWLQSVHMRWWDEIWTNCLLFNEFSLTKMQSKRCDRKTENSNRNWTVWTLNQCY